MQKRSDSREIQPVCVRKMQTGQLLESVCGVATRLDPMRAGRDAPFLVEPRNVRAFISVMGESSVCPSCRFGAVFIG